jgi:hypothetical protein
MLLPDFAYAELVKIVRHVMVRQRLLLTHTYKENREKDSRAGYILDVDTTPLSDNQSRCAKSTLSSLQLNQIVELAFREAMLICRDILHIPTARPREGHSLCLASLGVSNSELRTTLDGAGSHDDLTDIDLDSSDSDSDPKSEPQGTPEGAGEQKFPDIVASTAQLTARYSALCEDLDNTITQSNDYPLPLATPHAHTPYGPEVPPSLDIPSERKIHSHVLDSSGKVSVTKMLESRRVMQSGTTTKSERVVQLDPKFALRRVHESAEKVHNNETEIDRETASKEKLKASEASHRVRLHQSLHAASASQKKTRELRWQVAAKALQKALPDVGM